MNLAGPKASMKQAKGFYLVQATPATQVSPGNWRWLAGVALLLVFTNMMTYFSADKTSAPQFVADLREESLYLLEKAHQYIPNIPLFETRVREVSHSLDIPPEWLMAVMYTESKFNPAIENLRGSGATGLIQFMVPTVQELNDRLGTEYYMRDIRQMPAHEQLHLVEAYLQTVRERYGEYNSLTDLYLGILYPKAISQDYCYTLFSAPSRAYKQNIGLDENRDGSVTVSDIDRRLKRLYPRAYITAK